MGHGALALVETLRMASVTTRRSSLHPLTIRCVWISFLFLCVCVRPERHPSRLERVRGDGVLPLRIHPLRMRIRSRNDRRTATRAAHTEGKKKQKQR